MAEEIKDGAGEVERNISSSTVSKISAEDVLGNSELMAKILKSDVIVKLIQAETDKIRRKASDESKVKDDDFAKYKAETDAKISELTAFQKNYFKSEILKKSGLEVELWDYVKGETEEEIKKSASELKKLITKKAEETVGGKVQTGKTYTGITKEQFGKMNYTEKAELFRNNKELYESLIGG